MSYLRLKERTWEFRWSIDLCHSRTQSEITMKNKGIKSIKRSRKITSVEEPNNEESAISLTRSFSGESITQEL